jgi:dipeptidyl-peptidase-4
MRRFSLILAGSVSLLAFSSVVNAETAPLADRYATAQGYLAGKTGELVTDLDLRARFVAGGTKVLYRHGAKGQGTVSLANAVTGQITDLTTEAALQPLLAPVMGADAKGPFDVSPEDYNADKRSLTFSSGGKKLVLDLAANTVTVAPTAPSPAIDEGVVSPDGLYKVIHKGYDLALVEIATGKETALTANGSYDQRYGMNYPMFADMVEAQTETPPMPVSVQWSPDSKQILTYRMDRNGSYIWHGVQPNPPGSQFPRHYDYVYPTAGAEFVPQIVPVVIDVTAALKGPALPKVLNVPSNSLLWPGDPNMNWDKDKVLYQWTRRGYGEVDEYEIDPASNVATLRVHEAIKPIVTVTSSAIRPVPELNGDLVISERTGWAQLYYVAKGSNPSGGKALTKGNWEVTDIVRVDGKAKSLLVTGIGREAGVNPYFSSLYSVTLDGAIRNLTPEPLDHDVSVSEDGKTFIDKMSTPTTPPRTLLRSAEDGHIITELGHADQSALLASGFTPPEPFSTLADDGKTMLYGMIFRPKNFDPSHSYPVIEYVYTGPTTHVIDETYGRNIRNPAVGMAQIGAIVVEIDARGSSQRGQAFRLPAYQNLGEVGLDDHIWVLKAMKAKYSYFDLDRVGVFGHSAGGYDAARFILRRPDFYKVAVANSGNQDERLDKAWWPEVSMGIADDATWEKNSNVSVAGNLKGHLMLTHGDIDDNVPVAATLRLDAALVAANKPHELVIFANRTHNTIGPYYWRKHMDFFAQYLLGETPPAP